MVIQASLCKSYGNPLPSDSLVFCPHNCLGYTVVLLITQSHLPRSSNLLIGNRRKFVVGPTGTFALFVTFSGWLRSSSQPRLIFPSFSIFFIAVLVGELDLNRLG